MALPKQFLDLLRDRTSLHDIISKKLKLTKRNRDYLGLCPFHNEKTPSFTVSEERGSYHCFGCGAHGDAITFEMEVNNLSFHEAVEKLALSAGMEMPETTPEDRARAKKQSSLMDVVELATKFYEDELRKPANDFSLNYLKNRRELSDTTISNYRLGYAPRGNKLLHFLKSQGIDERQMEAACLIKKSQKDGSYYDYFRARVMFPIMNQKGQPVAFSGRVLDDSMPKYMNSSESEIFQKSHILYGYSQARDEAFKKKGIIAVEGNIDVIALAEHGIKNVVAPLGTAITEHHISALWRVSDTPFFCLDGDSAGYKAGIRTATRALPILKEGKSIKFVLLDNKKDPDDILKEGGKPALQKYFKQAITLSELLWLDLQKRLSHSTPEDKAMIEKEINEITNQIQNETIKKFYNRYFKDKMWELFRKNNNSKGQFKPAEKKTFVSRVNGVYSTVEKEILSYFISNPSLFENLLENNSLYKSDNELIKESFNVLRTSLIENPDLKRADAIEALKQNNIEEVLDIISREYNNIKNKDAKVVNLELQIIVKKKEKEQYEKDIRESSDWNLIKSLMENTKKLESEISEINLKIEVMNN